MASDIFGVSGTRIIEELMKGDLRPDQMAELSKGRLRKKKEDLTEALVGHMEEHHTFMIRASLEHIKAIEEILVTLEQKIQEIIGLHFKEEYDLLKTIPAVKDSASVIIAEIGRKHGPFCNRYAHFLMVRYEPRQQRKRGEEKTREPPHTAINP